MVAVTIVNIFSWRICTHILTRLHFMCWPHCAAGAFLHKSCIFAIAIAKVFSKWTLKANEMQWNSVREAVDAVHVYVYKHRRKMTQTNISQALDDVGLSAFQMCAIRINVHALGNSCRFHSLSLWPENGPNATQKFHFLNFVSGLRQWRVHDTLTHS